MRSHPYLKKARLALALSENPRPQAVGFQFLPLQFAAMPWLQRLMDSPGDPAAPVSPVSRVSPSPPSQTSKHLRPFCQKLFHVQGKRLRKELTEATAAARGATMCNTHGSHRSHLHWVLALVHIPARQSFLFDSGPVTVCRVSDPPFQLQLQAKGQNSP